MPIISQQTHIVRNYDTMMETTRNVTIVPPSPDNRPVGVLTAGETSIDVLFCTILWNPSVKRIIE